MTLIRPRRGMGRLLVGATALCLFTAVGATAQVGTPALPPGPGHDLTVQVCSSCHAVEVMAKQRLSRKAWAEMVELMASRGATASDAELAQITDYLALNFPDQPEAKPAPSH